MARAINEQCKLHLRIRALVMNDNSLIFISQATIPFHYSLNSSLFSDDENMCSDSEESTSEYLTVYTL